MATNGGWDPTSFCDPKGFGLGVNGDINNYDQNPSVTSRIPFSEVTLPIFI